MDSIQYTRATIIFDKIERLQDLLEKVAEAPMKPSSYEAISDIITKEIALLEDEFHKV